MIPRAEQQIINLNKELIEFFEQKIKDRIREVWGNRNNKLQAMDKLYSEVVCKTGAYIKFSRKQKFIYPNGKSWMKGWVG